MNTATGRKFPETVCMRIREHRENGGLYWRKHPILKFSETVVDRVSPNHLNKSEIEEENMKEYEIDRSIGMEAAWKYLYGRLYERNENLSIYFKLTVFICLVLATGFVALLFL